MLVTQERDRPAIKLIDDNHEILVTESMINVGMDVFREHHYGGDDRYMLECVFRAMLYERLEASDTKASR